MCYISVGKGPILSNIIVVLKRFVRVKNVEFVPQVEIGVGGHLWSLRVPVAFYWSFETVLIFCKTLIEKLDLPV
jgi:hypothetical protein